MNSASVVPIRRLKCLGCSAFLKDVSEFQQHCAVVQHSEDFNFECEEVDENAAAAAVEAAALTKG